MTTHAPTPWQIYGNQILSNHKIEVCNFDSSPFDYETKWHSKVLIAFSPAMIELLKLIEAPAEEEFKKMDRDFAINHLRHIKSLCHHLLSNIEEKSK